ncbi:leucine-rich repeat protein [Butyricicoccus faecihominis]|uniref:leucine-rich repeat protein n=1 Tax=Butyricicoccus faecihominis TaxID=1712515 RepID=UPI00247B18C2|nr:leucine-rich repeat protein [Butyricicoccus faecihominis]MCQ5128801.1 leucine-rich repeat protein [Butyricicoccus faecihominis]
MKKFLSSILATVMLLSVLTVPAYASTWVVPVNKTPLPFTDADYLREDFGYQDYKEYISGPTDKKAVAWPEGATVVKNAILNEGGDIRDNEDYDSSATTITLPKSTVIIGLGCLNYRKSVTTINWKDLVNLKFIDGLSVGYTKISTLDLTNTQVVRIGDAAFSNSNNLTTFKAPSTLKRIDAHAFEGCLRITTLELNEGLEYIGESALDSGYGYNNVIIPSTVTYIGSNGLRTDKTYKVYQGSYGEQWCKDNNVKYTYVDGSTTPSTTPPTTPTTNPSQNTTAPTMEHTQKVGGVTFSNFVSQKEIVAKDTNSVDIPVFVVEIGPNGCMRSDVDNTDFIYWSAGSWGASNPYNGETYGVYTDKGAWNGDYRTETLDMHNITPYPSTKNSNGTWSKGLTWQYGDFDTEYVDYNKYRVTVNEGKNVYYYYIKVVQNPVYSTNTETSVTPSTPSQSATANPNNSKVLVNGKTVAFDAYNINNNNYFKLRDIAQVLRGTDKQFEVVWDSSKNAINMTSNKAYTTVGGELKTGDGVTKECVLNSSPIYKDGVQVSLTAYTINGNNYFKLRDLGEAFNFDVSWDAGQNAVVIDTSHAYNADT